MYKNISDEYKIRKRDIILCFILLVIGIIGFIAVKVLLRPGNVAKVYIDDKLVDTLDLSTDDTYVYRTSYGTNTIVVENETVRMESADCPDKVCVNMGDKTKSGETITCLPHRMVIEVRNDKERDVDVQ